MATPFEVKYPELRERFYRFTDRIATMNPAYRGMPRQAIDLARHAYARAVFDEGRRSRCVVCGRDGGVRHEKIDYSLCMGLSLLSEYPRGDYVDINGKEFADRLTSHATINIAYPKVVRQLSKGVHWGLVERRERGYYRITDKGRAFQANDLRIEHDERGSYYGIADLLDGPPAVFETARVKGYDPEHSAGRTDTHDGDG